MHDPIVDPHWLRAERAHVRAIVTERDEDAFAFEYYRFVETQRRDRELRRARPLEAAPHVVRRAAATGVFRNICLFEARNLTCVWGRGVTAWMIASNDEMYLRLVNAPPGARAPTPMQATEGEAISFEPASAPFQLRELGQDRLWKLSRPLHPGETLGAGDGAWTFDPTPKKHGTNKTLRQEWKKLIKAYVNDQISDDADRQHDFKAALFSLLWFKPKSSQSTGDDVVSLDAIRESRTAKPRMLRPWPLLTLAAMAAEITQDSDDAKRYGLDTLADHPQCFESLRQQIKG